MSELNTMKKAEATLSVSCTVDCPHCDNMIELMDRTALTDDGYIYSEVMDDVQWGHEDWGEVILCEECNNKFLVGAVIW